MSNAFVRKLSARAELLPQQAAALEGACGSARRYPAKHDLIREGDDPGPVYVFLEGWGCRYKLLPEGGRQILAFMLPGDFCDLHTNVLNEMDHTIATVTPALVAMIPRARMRELVDMCPEVTRAFWWTQLVDLGVARAWIASLGRRGSMERVAHLMCEIYIQASAHGLTDGDRCTMPLSQILLADALGLTPVHVNRVLRAFKARGIMQLTRGALVVSDIAELVRVAGFDNGYLQQRLR